MLEKGITNEFDPEDFDEFEMIGQIFRNACVGVKPWKIIAEIKLWFKRLILGSELIKQ